MEDKSMLRFWVWRNNLGRSLGIVVLGWLCLATSLSAQGEYVLEIDDPLTTGTSVGDVKGGTFTDGGWKTTGREDRIRYEIETCPYGKIEFDVQGLYASNDVFENIGYYRDIVIEDMHYTLLAMFDADTDGSWFGKTMPESGIKQWHNPYKMVAHLFGYVEGDQWKWKHGRFRLNVAAFTGGYDDDPQAFEIEYGPVEWRQDHTFHVVLEWGQGKMTYFIDGEEWVVCDYSSFGDLYAPPEHIIHLGGAVNERGLNTQVPKLITYSNFKFYRNQDNLPPQVVETSPKAGSTNNPLDSYIAINFNEGIDLESALNTFQISPSVSGNLRSEGNTLYYDLSEMLQSEITYTVSVGTELMDKAGNHLEQPVQYQFTTGNTIPSMVKKYDILEIPIIAPGLGGNKYLNYSLKGVFQGPTKTIEIDGFWDGGDVWKVRMAPTQVGTWTYTISGNNSAFSQSGSFECIESDSKGFIVKNPDHPYTFMYEDGTPWMWKGETSWRGMLSTVPYESRWKEYIDLRAEQGYNAVQFILVSYIRGDAFWANEGGTIFTVNSSGKNYDELNPEYFKWVDRRIEYALSKGILPVFLFTWAQEFVKFSQSQFENFSEYIVSRYAAYNVFWCISGEYNETYNEFGTPQSVWRHHGLHVKDIDPYDHLITLHPTGRTSSREFGHEDWFGFVMQQTGYWHNDVKRDRVFNKPVVNGEYGYAGYNPDENIRIGAWEILTSGGFFTAGFFNTFAPDKGGWNLESNQHEQDMLAFTFDFMENTKWWAMEPRHDLVSNGHCIAIPGEEYIIYSQTGGATQVNLSHVSGTIPVEWINLRELTFSDRTNIQGGSTVSLTPPFSGDWVLHIGEGIPQDAVLPNAPSQLTMNSHTMSSITLSWIAPSPASDGDTAVKYAIHRDGTLVGHSSTTQFTDVGLASATEYSYEVYAIDDARNQSTSAAAGSFSTDADTVPPTVESVVLLTPTELHVTFNEKIDQTTAETLSNYTITPARNINSATLLSDQKSVQLITNTHQEDILYTLGIQNIKDRAVNPNTISPSTTQKYRLEATLQVADINQSNYQTDSLQVGKEYYIDRTFTIESIPPQLENLLLIKTANIDKYETGSSFLSFRINRGATVYIAFDQTNNLPTWMQDWTSTGQLIGTTDDVDMEIYKKDFPAGTVELGANYGGDHNSMYFVLLEGAESGDKTPPAAPQGLVVRPAS